MSASSVDLSRTEEGFISLLLSDYRSESEKGWRYVYKEFYPSVQKYIRNNNGTEDDAADIFQDGTMILLRNLQSGRFREEALLKTYLFSICRNLWLKELARREKKVINFVELTFHSQEDGSKEIDSEVINLLLMELKDDCRTILVEFYYGQKSLAQLMQIFSVNSIQVVQNKKQRCLSYLMRIFKERSASQS